LSSWIIIIIIIIIFITEISRVPFCCRATKFRVSKRDCFNWIALVVNLLRISAVQTLAAAVWIHFVIITFPGWITTFVTCM